MAPFPPISGLSRPLKIRIESLLSPTLVSTEDSPTLVSRQTVETVTVVANSGGGGGDSVTLSGGAIAGIVIGSIAGCLLFLWIVRSCFNLGAPPQEREAWYQDAGEKPRRRHRHRSRHRSVGLSTPPPVIIRDSSRSHRRQPSTTYVYTEGDGRGRRHSRTH